MRWVVIVGFTYLAVVGFFFIEGGPQVPAILFWSITVGISIIAFLIVLFKVWFTGNSFLWKLQRMTGALMFPMLLGHMLFMHMNYLTGHDSKAILLRTQATFIKGMDLVFVIVLLFHAGYGLFSILADYIKPGLLLKLFTFIILIAMAIATFFGVRLIVAL